MESEANFYCVFFLQSKTKSIYFRITYPFFEMQTDQDNSYERVQRSYDQLFILKFEVSKRKTLNWK